MTDAKHNNNRNLHCAQCGKELANADDVLVCLDNWLQWEHFAKIGCNAGCFCSTRCFATYWSCEEYTVDEYFEEVI